MRGVGVAATTTVQWGANMLVAALFPIAAHTLGMQTVLCGFLAVCVVAWAVVYLAVPETRGVALEDVWSKQHKAGAKGEKE